MTRRQLLTAAAFAPWLAPGLCGCNTGGGMPQMVEPTKPRMDREVETGAPARTNPPPVGDLPPPENDNPRRQTGAPRR